MDLARCLRKLNQQPIWSGTVKLWNNSIRVASLDRLLYVVLHYLRVMGTEERRFFAEQLRPGMAVVDVGTNIGLYALMFADLIGDTGRVYGFEPDPVLFGTACSNVELNRKQDRVLIRNLALGSRTGEALLFRGNFNSGDNRLSAESDRDAIAVKVARLDDVLPDVSVDWIKVDVQGWELEVLRGMRQTLERNASAAIYFEFWPEGLRAAGENPSELVALLSSMGYEIVDPRTMGPPFRKQDVLSLESSLGAHGYTALVALKRNRTKR